MERNNIEVIVNETNRKGVFTYTIKVDNIVININDKGSLKFLIKKLKEASNRI